MALFKQPDNIVRKLDAASVINNIERNYFSIQVPIKYGETFTGCPVIYRHPYGRFPERNGTVTYYALSASFYNQTDSHWNTNGDFIDRLQFDNVQASETSLIAVNTGVRDVLTGATRGRQWNRGRTSGASLAAIGTFNQRELGGGQLIRGNNPEADNLIYFTYLKAGDDITQTDLYRAFGPNGFVDQGVIEKIDNRDFDSLVLIKRSDPIFGIRSIVNFDTAGLRAKYVRGPVVRDTNGQYVRVAHKLGNFIYEFFTNSRWGLNINSSKIARADFVDQGAIGGGSFFPYNYPLTRLFELLEVESGNMLLEQQGIIRFKPKTTLNVAITDANIIGNIEIQYPDISVLPTQLIAQYNSKEKGLTNIVYGTDPTKIEAVFIETASTFAQADTIATQLLNDINVVTIKFKADRSVYQLTLNDTLTLATSVFSGTITIVELQLLDDFTIEITAEANTNAVVPTFRIDQAQPIIKIDNGYYRPKINERDFDPDNPIIVPPAPPVPTPPDIIEPPARILRTFSGLEHPYNFVTQSLNTDWYLGSTLDGLTVDNSYDINGCKTRFYNNFNQYAYYVTDFSLIFRPANEEIPVGIKVAYDIALSSGERNGGIVGSAFYKDTFRVQFPGFFSDENNTFRSRSIKTTDWVLGNKGWGGSFPYSTIPGGTKDRYFANANDNEFVFQIGADITPLLNRGLSTFDTQNSRYIVNLPSSFRAQFASETMRKSNGGVNFYRLHFSAIYGDINNPTRVKYIGSTSTFGDGRSILPDELSEARNTARAFGVNWNYNYISPPTRSAT
jgi:hypothetical protein